MKWHIHKSNSSEIDQHPRPTKIKGWPILQRNEENPIHHTSLRRETTFLILCDKPNAHVHVLPNTQGIILNQTESSQMSLSASHLVYQFAYSCGDTDKTSRRFSQRMSMVGQTDVTQHSERLS